MVRIRREINQTDLYRRNKSRHGRHKAWRNLRRKLRAGFRDSYLLLREFAWPLVLFLLAMAGGGILYFVLANRAGQPAGSLTEAVYTVVALTFLESVGEFPRVWYLQAFYFLMPLIGIGILALGLADFGHLFFNRRARGKEWEMAVASTFNDHIVLVGLGHLGFRVAKNLYELDQDVVVIELNPKAELIASAHEMGIPVIQDDGKRTQALVGAGIEKARALLLCTQNDNLNMQIAFKARKLNPAIQIVIRIFDDDFAEAVQEQFGFRAMSATGMAAPTFAATAAGVDITRPITVEGQSLSLARLDVRTGSGLSGLSVAELEQTYQVSVVLVCQNEQYHFHPAGELRLAGNDIVAVLAGPEQVSRLANDNR